MKNIMSFFLILLADKDFINNLDPKKEIIVSKSYCNYSQRCEIKQFRRFN